MSNNRQIIFNEFNQENKNLVAFIDDVFTSTKNIEIVCPDKNNSTEKMPDFYVMPEKYLIEVKRLYDFDDIKASGGWAKIIGKLQKLVNSNLTEINPDGFYMIETPRHLKLSNERQKLLYEAILNSLNSSLSKFYFDEYNFSVQRISTRDKGITFSTSWGGSINPAGTIFQNLGRLLKEKVNLQLENGAKKYESKKKILLLINNYVYADRISEVIEGLSYCYNDLLSYGSIDEIWFQQEMQNSTFRHTQIYDRDFLQKFESEELNSENVTHQQQFELWYWALEKMEDKKEKIFLTLQIFLEKNSPEDIFQDPYKREAMTRLGIWLIENDRIDDVTWLIEKFINDPNPPEPGEYEGDPDFDYDQKIREGENNPVISTVMGHLAWTVLSLARKSSTEEPDNLLQAFEFTHEVLSRRNLNLYVVQQWLIPLAEISNRRWLLFDKDIELYRKFRGLLLDRKNGLVAKYSKFRALKEHMINAFAYLQDMNTDDVKYVLGSLQSEDRELASLMIYYAIFRKNHYKKNTALGKKVSKIDPTIISYDPAWAIGYLENTINSSENAELLRSIAWNFWKISEDSPEEYKNIKPWIDKVFDSPNAVLFSDQLKIVLMKLIDKYPDDCLIWLDKLICIFEKKIKNGKTRPDRVLFFPEVTRWLETNKEKEQVLNIIKRLEVLKNNGFYVR